MRASNLSGQLDSIAGTRERQQFDRGAVESSNAMSDRVAVRVQQDPFQDHWGVQWLEPFVEENFVILTSRVEIDGLQ